MGDIAWGVVALGAAAVSTFAAVFDVAVFASAVKKVQ